MASFAPGNGEGWTVVRLSDIPREMRQEAAHALAKMEGLRGEAYASLMLAAFMAFPDALLEVPSWKADRVLRQRKFPPGAFPRFDGKVKR